MKCINVFDDFVLSRTDNTRRVFKQPEWLFDKAFTDPDNIRAVNTTAVVKAPCGGYMMTYRGVPDLAQAWSDENLSAFLAHSDDGISFQPYKVNPSAEYPHLLGKCSEEIGVHPYLDERETDPGLRYKSPFMREGKNVNEPMIMLGSPDLVHWQRVSDAPLTTSTVDCYPNLIYNPVTGRYQVTTRRRHGERRICLTESADFQSWSEPRCIIHPLPTDEPTTHLYSMPHMYYEPGDIFIGMNWIQVMPFDRIMDGPVYTEYAYSYDGLTWNRTGARVFPELPREHYGAGMNLVSAMLDRGDDVVFYCNAYVCEHNGIPGGWKEGMPPMCVTIPGVLKKNRFVCIDSGKGKGELMSQWLRLKKPELTLNAVIPFGSLRCELSAGDEPVPGFSFDDFEPIGGDSTEFMLRWKGGNLADLVESGKWFKLHIEMTDSEVYAVNGDFDFTVFKRAWMYDRL